jgi:hypothetical protein
VLDESKKKYDAITKCKLFARIEIERFQRLENAEPSIKSTF